MKWLIIIPALFLIAACDGTAQIDYDDDLLYNEELGEDDVYEDESAVPNDLPTPDIDHDPPVNDFPDIEYGDQDLKPNIYLYPTAPLDITVKIGFPQGGRVTVSEPLYGDGWTVRVTPDGLIDGQWRFLFYESVQPNGWQRERGYLVPTDGMEAFFRNDLAARGFVGQEIEDFIEWWMPLLAEPGYLIVYPQDAAVISALEDLQLSVTPDSLLRHRYVIETTAEPVTIEPPDAPAPFSRDGFTVTEWGVIRI